MAEASQERRWNLDDILPEEEFDGLYAEIERDLERLPEYFGKWVDNKGDTVYLFRGWYPDADLNQALPLLDAFNTKYDALKTKEKYKNGKKKWCEIMLTYRGCYELSDRWEIEWFPRPVNVDSIMCSTENLAPKLTETILERLERLGK